MMGERALNNSDRLRRARTFAQPHAKIERQATPAFGRGRV